MENFGSFLGMRRDESLPFALVFGNLPTAQIPQLLGILPSVESQVPFHGPPDGGMKTPLRPPRKVGHRLITAQTQTVGFPGLCRKGFGCSPPTASGPQTEQLDHQIRDAADLIRSRSEVPRPAVFFRFLGQSDRQDQVTRERLQ